MSETLPQGWANPELQDLCLFNPKHPSETIRNMEVSFVPMPAVSDLDGVILPHTSKTLDEVWKGYTHFADNDVIFAKITPCMENGKIAVAKNLINGLACGSTEFHVLRSQGALVPNYLYRFLRQESYRQDAEQVMTGAVGQRRVPASFLKETKLPLPPLAEQKRIVAKLEALLTRSTNARTELSKIPRLIERYKQAVLAAAFRGLPKESVLEEICTDIVDCLHTTAKFTPSGYYCVDTTCLKDGELVQGKMRYVDEATYIERTRRLEPRVGDIIFSREGTIGLSMVIPSNMKICLGQRMMMFRPASSINPYYLHYYFRSPLFKQQWQALVTGSTSPHVNIKDLRKTFIKLPESIETQNKIVEEIESALTSINSIEAELTKAEALRSRLEQATLAKAFKGQLVPQNPNDEPASVLLARIRAERALQVKPSKGRVRSGKNH